MRARNREVNIFNMSLLDILTGMLGAFLFLMIGMVPYYTKVVTNKVGSEEDMKRLRQLEQENADLRSQVGGLEAQIAQLREENANLRKQIEELQKMLAQTGGGPLSQEEIEKLLKQKQALEERVSELESRVASLEKENDSLEAQVAMLRQERDEWKQKALDNQEKADKYRQWELTIATWWNSQLDFDFCYLLPDGKLYAPKAGDYVKGTKAIEGIIDSHQKKERENPPTGLDAVFNTRVRWESFTIPPINGDYLIMIRTPKDIIPTAPIDIQGGATLSKDDWADTNIGLRRIVEGPLKPDTLYAICVLNVNLNAPTYETRMSWKAVGDTKLPAGVIDYDKREIPTPTPTPAIFAPPTPLPPLTPEEKKKRIERAEEMLKAMEKGNATAEDIERLKRAIEYQKKLIDEPSP